MDKRYKYPRTRHLPWSPGVTCDDLHIDSLQAFVDQEIVVTEKMDGENTTIYRDHIHARSIDGKHHTSRTWVKSLQGQIGHNIPEGWRICGENMYARHSIDYTDLPSYFLVFSIWDQNNRCLSWTQTLEWASLLGLSTVPEIYRGIWDVQLVKNLTVDTTKSEGYVVRLSNTFPFEKFSSCVGKWVRQHHVETHDHWLLQPVVPNGLRK